MVINKPVYGKTSPLVLLRILMCTSFMKPHEEGCISAELSSVTTLFTLAQSLPNFLVDMIYEQYLFPRIISLLILMLYFFFFFF